MMPSPACACRLFLAVAAVFGSFPEADATNEERVTVPENFRLQRLVNEGTYGRPGAYLFKLYYTGTTKPAAYLYRAFAAPAELVEHEHGVVQIVLWNNETVDAELDLHLPDVTYSFRFSALSQWIPRGENLPDFSLEIQPGRDVTYVPGNDVEVEFTLRYGSPEDRQLIDDETLEYKSYVPNPSAPNPGFDMYRLGFRSRSVYDSFNESSRCKFGEATPLSPVRETSSELATTHRFRWKACSSERNLDSGVVAFTAVLSTQNGPMQLLLDLRATTYVRIHRADGEGPLSAGYVGFLTYEPFDFVGIRSVALATDQCGSDQHYSRGYCGDGYCFGWCEVCVAAGDQTTEVELSRVLPSGELAPLHQPMVVTRWDGFVKQAQPIIDMQGATTSGVFNYVYLCTARTATNEISKNITVVVQDIRSLLYRGRAVKRGLPH